MQISKHTVVTLTYSLKNDHGELIDESDASDPLAYVHGTGSLIPGLEDELQGKTVGDEISVIIPPAKAYGDRDPALVQDVPREAFAKDLELEVGMHIQIQGEGGDQVVTIAAIEAEQVTLDANHPLSGETLHFDVGVVDVRDATAEELSHGHVHGPGGHDH